MEESTQMRVLLTNAALDSRAGSELYCRDVAIGLRRRGHRPVVFAPVLGEVARELRDATVPIVDDLDDLGEPPEVIHGQHHLPTVMAILRFPGVPAVYVCHGWRPWNERPPRLRRIRRYVAVDEAVRDRLVFENGVPERLVRILPNFVDLDRFPPRSSALPERPQRALLFSNYATESSPYARAVREASREFGIEVDIVGAGVGRTIANPGEVLRSYDLVFAQGRSAIEAMAAGASVVVASSRAFGPLVTSSNVRRLRELNFGIRALDRPPAAESLIAEIRRYDSADATAVSQIIRTEAALDPAIDALVSVYKESAEESSGATEGTRTGEVAEIVAYLRSLDAVVRAAESRAETCYRQSELIESLRRDLDRAESLLAAIRATATWRLRNLLLATSPASLLRKMLGRLRRSAANDFGMDGWRITRRKSRN